MKVTLLLAKGRGAADRGQRDEAAGPIAEGVARLQSK
jgi:hypothetical protein